MTAIIIVTQPSRGLLHVASDAAMYRRDQVVVSFGTKVMAVAHWPGVITNTGISSATTVLGAMLADRFETFDEMLIGSEAALPSMIEECAPVAGAEVILAGISTVHGPAAFSFRTDDSLPPVAPSEQQLARLPPPLRLARLPNVVMTPIPDDQIEPANYEGIDVDAPTELIIWSIRKLLEMQRCMKLPDGIGSIGGFGHLTTVSREGITERMLQQWPDETGDVLQPIPIDWAEWHRDNPRPGVISKMPEGMSRLQRDIAMRKAKKAARVRAV